jgi:hypothetical protein
MIRWRPILIATDIAVGAVGLAVFAGTWGGENILMPFFFVGWLLSPLAVTRRREDLRPHFIAGFGVVVAMLAAGAVSVVLVIFLLLAWLLFVARIAFSAAER